MLFVFIVQAGGGNLPQSTSTSTTPTTGRIYYLRLTVEGVVGFKKSRSSASASYASSTSSSSTTASSTTSGGKRKRSNHNKRPCLVLYVENETVSVLLFSHLHEIDPRADDPTKSILVPELPREEVLTYLLSIYPTPPLLDGRRGVVVTKPNNSRHFPSDKNHYVILKIMKLPITTSFGNPVDAYFQRDELLYINEIMFEIDKQKKIELINNAPSVSNIIQNQNDDSNDDGESVSSSIPNPRSIFEFIKHDNFNKSKYIRIQNWLNNSSSSSDLIPEDDLQNSFH